MIYFRTKFKSNYTGLDCERDFITLKFKVLTFYRSDRFATYRFEISLLRATVLHL